MTLSDATIRAVEKRSLREDLAGADGLGAKVQALVLYLRSTRLGRAGMRIGAARANVLAGGIAYAALFSLFAALVIGWSAFMAVLGGNEELRNAVLDSIDSVMPGLVGYGSDDLISPEDLVLPTVINVTSVVSILVLVWSSLTMMTALKTSIRQMFGIQTIPENFVLVKARDLMGFFVLALAVLLTAALSVAVNAIGSVVFEWLGVEGSLTQWLLRLATIAVTFLVDLGVFVFIIRIFAGVRAPRRDLLLGAVVGALATGVLRYLGTAAVSLPQNNPVLGTFAVLITLLLWINLMARLVLYVAAFTANPPAADAPSDPAEVHFYAKPNYVTVSVPSTLRWNYEPSTGAVIPDPSLGADAPPEPEPEPEPEPRWGGLMGWWFARRLARAEKRLERAKGSYYK